MAKKTIKIPKKAKQTIIFLGLIVLILWGIKLFNPPPLEKQKGVEERSQNIYFIKDGKARPAKRNIKEGKDLLSQALNELVKGPTDAEYNAGYMTGLPEGCKVLAIKIKGGTAEIIFNQKLENFRGGAGEVETMLAQIVYTAADIPGVNKVLIKIKGRNEVVLGGEGFVIDRPLSRSDLGR